MNQHPWLNLELYTVTELMFLFVGTLFWIGAYFLIIRNAIKYKMVEMPFLAVCSNIGWEFAWSFLLYTNLGRLFEYGLRVWFFMDVLIFYFTVKYGAAQMSKDLFKQYFFPFLILVTLWWVPVFYFFEVQHHDTAMGTSSAFLITVVMAALFIFNATRTAPGLIATKGVAWGNFLGNLGMAIFVFIHHDGAHFTHLLAGAVLVMNIVYIIQTYRRSSIFAVPPPKQ